MATDEASFKQEFRKSLEYHCPNAYGWANTDKMRCGLPDRSYSYRGHLYGIEVKFVKELPKRQDSAVLKHKVSAAQKEHLEKLRKTGNYGSVLIGFSDVAVLMQEIKIDYTLQEVLDARRIYKAGKFYDVANFFDLMENCSG